MTKRNPMMFLIPYAALLGLAGCGQEDSAAGPGGNEPTTTALRAVYESAIHVNDQSGRARAGVALSTRPFAGPADTYLGSAHVILSSEATGMTGTARPPFSVRLETARRLLGEKPVAEPDPIALAYVFEDDDVVGWTGSSLSDAAFAAALDPGKAGDGVTEVKSALVAGFYNQEEFVLWDQTTYTPMHLCYYAGYAVGWRTEGSWSNYTDATFQYYLGGTHDSQFTIRTTSYDRYYNSGNWWWRGIGYYYVKLTNVGGFATIQNNIGCMF